MRLYPASIAGRTALVLAAGLVLTLLASTAVFWLDPAHVGGADRFPRVVARVVNIAALVNRVPAATRPEVLAALDDGDIEALWKASPEPSRPGHRGWLVRHLERDLREAMGGSARPLFIGRRPSGPGGHDHVVDVWVRLDDGTWLNLALRHEVFRGDWLLRLGAALAILAAGLIALGIWAGRRVTAPLHRFAGAAARLGTDVEAPPLDESGASEIRQAARAFNEMQERIRRFLGDRTQMLAAISHDLRTPITRLRLRAEFIDDAEQREKTLKDLDEMERMIAAAIAFAREESAEEARISVDLMALLGALVREAGETGGAVCVEGPPALACACRPTALRRAFANLIDNAVKYGSRAAVTVRDESARIVVTIDDEGPGIPEDQLEAVFRPFHRVEPSRSRETGGTGLGLAVARSVIRGHGGDVTLANRPGGGLRQTVTLPREP